MNQIIINFIKNNIVNNKSQILIKNEIKDESKKNVINKEFNKDEENEDNDILKKLGDSGNENLFI